MAWSQIPKSGESAPCNPPTCAHRDCQESVTTIRADCARCHTPIGYQKFCRDSAGRLVHWTCELEAR